MAGLHGDEQQSSCLSVPGLDGGILELSVAGGAGVTRHDALEAQVARSPMRKRWR